MLTYNPVTPELLEELKKTLGERYVVTDPDRLEAYKTDEEGNPRYHQIPEVVVFPENTEQVAAVAKLANRYKVPITPRGAGTGLGGGAIPIHKGIVLVLERLNKIIKIDKDAMYMIAQAGVRTDEIQKEAKKHGMLYAGDPCSADSCQIGGNVATNAGGNWAVKYGTTRHQVYAIEIVTPEGDIVKLGGRLAKKTTGYCLEQLIIGSEGTLGIVTQVTLKLLPFPTKRIDMLAIFSDVKTAIDSVGKILKSGATPTSVEFMANPVVCQVANYLKMELPHAAEGGHYLIITADAYTDDDLDQKTVLLDEVLTENGALKVLIADEARIWKARKNVSETMRSLSRTRVVEDVVVPLDKISDVVDVLLPMEKKYGIPICITAHAGDGNIHAAALKCDMPDDLWQPTLDKFHEELYTHVYKMGGCLSGEHGIGLKKVKEMEQFTNPVELKIMKAIKKALDPNGILNPDKVFKLDYYC